MKRIDDNVCYAYRIYPEPSGTNYFQKDLMKREQVEKLFDFCQILEAIIYDIGWDFLIDYYGYPVLYEINSKSGWLNCTNLEEYKEYIDSYRNDNKKLNRDC